MDIVDAIINELHCQYQGNQAMLTLSSKNPRRVLFDSVSPAIQSITKLPLSNLVACRYCEDLGSLRPVVGAVTC